MRILITGNMGYVGPVVASHLRSVWREAELIGYDNALFATQVVSADPFPERVLDRQLFGDIRNIRERDLKGVDAVVHLSAISNDPMGNRFEKPTVEINHEASERLAALSVAAGVGTFVMASSCSIYGIASDAPRREGDPLSPLTAYARSKIATEEALAQLDAPEMRIICLRFATACGMSPRLRLDLVLNDFVAAAVCTEKIKVLSDGTPWRPLIDVSDMARAIEWALQRRDDPRFLAVNVGANDQNYTVAQLAEAVASAVPGTTVSINRDAPPDKRSYRCDFGLYEQLAPDHQPCMRLADTIERLVEGLKAWPNLAEGYRNSDAMRLFTLERHINAGRLDADIRWTDLATQSAGA